MSTAKAKAMHRVSDSYLDMIRAFPLYDIRTDAQSDAACAVLEKWFGRDDFDQGQADYVRTLATLVADYENRVHPYQHASRSVSAKLRGLMEEAKLTQTQLGRIAGVDQSQISLILSGKRELSKGSIRRLAAHFKLTAGFFL